MFIVKLEKGCAWQFIPLPHIMFKMFTFDSVALVVMSFRSWTDRKTTLYI